MTAPSGCRPPRDAFYRGPIARLIAECSEKVGGIISTDDLASYGSRFETPVGGSFHGYDINGQDSWSQGPMLMQTLNILENFDLKAMGHNSPAYIHTVSEALKLCFGDREAFYADSRLRHRPGGRPPVEGIRRRARPVD